ncbi:MAG TPA: hypothetical protein VFG59_20930 [Anaeromyxobacter sp.]|nr:hypothetical protein [Anaeromyxobacter sp.]
MSLPVPQLVPLDPGLLERRAQDLAKGAAAQEGLVLDHLVSFRLRGEPCAVVARVVERAVARLSRALAVPLAEGGTRLVTFVEERPVPVVDLAGLAAGAAREAETLEGEPALVVATGLGPVAVVVEGPLELLEDHLAHLAQGGDAAPIRTLGLLSGGATVIDPTWLGEWAGKAVRP